MDGHITETNRDQDRETLLARIDMLERENAALREKDQQARHIEDEFRASEARFRALLAGLHVGVVMQDPTGKNILFNPHALTLLGVTEDQLLGRTSFDPRWGAVYEDGSPCPGDAHPITVALRTGKPVRDFVHGVDRPALGDRVWLLVSAAPQLDDRGVVTGAIATFTDITARKDAEDLVRSQSRMLEEMSTPLVPISDDIVAMPLVGTVDARRAELVLETLLAGIAQKGARVAILDITGVSVVDAHVATTLVRAAQAARLLGAQVVLTGIRGSVAQTLVELGVDLSGLVTRGTLQGGIAWAFSRRS
ncbi:STAS domain-containing protein [Polyangium sp. 15x6]|uniref:STAS domain-containing protein n=1 Tax=Polyangium sp. 15x6 TaxID=3042687 RepID=UPI002499B655|nr:STAS domain-containing protein [Polyangium sp. 15x6]MDI3288477.1 PAS domain S-box protein [Polyangium sp. 15x6]